MTPTARLPDYFNHIASRRAALHGRLDVVGSFELLEESCVPSYVHRNWAAAGVAWWRLFVAAQLFRQFAPRGPVLDFGAATGEIRHIIGPIENYQFVEGNDALAAALIEGSPDAKRLTLGELPEGNFATIFALDSLEHNENVAELLALLRKSLRDDGVIIISGPTENVFYRFGRKLSGFDGHYHKTTIYDIEGIAHTSLHRVGHHSIPFMFPLFRHSVWKK